MEGMCGDMGLGLWTSRTAKEGARTRAEGKKVEKEEKEEEEWVVLAVLLVDMA